MSADGIALLTALSQRRRANAQRLDYEGSFLLSLGNSCADPLSASQVLMGGIDSSYDAADE